MQKLTKQQIADNNAVEAVAVADKTPPAVSVTVHDDALVFTFGDGTTTEFLTHVQTVEMQKRAMLHGFEQKIRDAAALSLRNVGGRIVRPSVAEKKAAVLAMIAQLCSGTWNATREPGEQSSSALWEAFNVARPGKFTDFAAFQAQIEARGAKIGVDGNAIGTKAVKKAISEMPDVAAEIAKQRAARRPADGIDAETIVDGF